MPKIFVLLYFLNGLLFCHGDKSTNHASSKLILVSFDGFRADYLTKYQLPNLNGLIKEGILVEHVKNIFITKTFPNHYTLVTGLYAENHGIVANSMYDPDLKQMFNLVNGSNPVWWNEATPIWVTNQQQGHKSGSAMWPGSEVQIKNITTSEYLKYNRNVSFAERVDNITTWLTRSKDPINFATLYWEEPDASGHQYGPDDVEHMSKVLNYVDTNIGYLITKLKNLNLWDSVNVIITSDHGMAQCSKDRVIKLDDCIDRASYTLVDDNPVAAILPIADKMQVYNRLKNCSAHMKAYLKEDIPDKYHYKHNNRIQPILLVADEGWSIVRNGSLPKMGNHGYDNDLPSMHPFLAAHGPAFRKDYKISTINSVDIYPMMCHILGLKEESNNGTFSNTKCLLADQWCIHVPEAVGIVIGVIMVLTTLTCVIILLKKKMPSPRPFSRLEFQDDDDPLIG
ncbi:bis(5'-adenosyl)-triphosphatase ENPP4 [Bombina bombina]|uniref:bis(5'-adenosyl)-triphosphatase ENPP4 n=1 Tax=Bombina bombina TaxID=8345 RepID=UPI00235A6D79|nr:bis(5'-adenosyl)-triphosphatase ENPP4 [Bombina bombina]